MLSCIWYVIIKLSMRNLFLILCLGNFILSLFWGWTLLNATNNYSQKIDTIKHSWSCNQPTGPDVAPGFPGLCTNAQANVSDPIYVAAVRFIYFLGFSIVCLLYWKKIKKNNMINKKIFAKALLMLGVQLFFYFIVTNSILHLLGVGIRTL